MSEAELHILKQRMHQGKLSKARRGELALPVPTGYVRQPSGEVIFDPDEEVQRVVRLIFRKFEELGTLHGVLAYLVEHGVKLGIRVRQGEAKGELEWRRPNRMTLQNLLRHPIYAGSLRLWPSPGGSPQEEARPPFHRAHGGASRSGTSSSRAACRPTSPGSTTRETWGTSPKTGRGRTPWAHPERDLRCFRVCWFAASAQLA